MATTTTNSLAPGLSRKVKKVSTNHRIAPPMLPDVHPLPMQILEIKTESQDLITALQTLSTFYEDNSPAARRVLRSTIEKRGLEIHEQFLSSAEAAIKVHRHAMHDHAQGGDELLVSLRYVRAPVTKRSAHHSA